MDTPDPSALRNPRVSSADRSGSPRLFSMDALFNKKSGSRSSDRGHTSSSSDVTQGSPTVEEHKRPGSLKFGSLGRRVSLATTSIDRFAKSTKDKLSKKLGGNEPDSGCDREEHGSRPADAGGSGRALSPVPSAHAVPQDSAPGTPVVVPVCRGGEGAIQDRTPPLPEAVPASRRSFSADYVEGSTNLSAGHGSPSQRVKKKHSPIKIDKQSFKVFGEKISHAAKNTGRKMSQLGNEIENGVNKLGQQLHLKEAAQSEERVTAPSGAGAAEPALEQAPGGDTAFATPSPSGRPSRVSLGGDEAIQYPRLQRRVSDVLEIDKMNLESDIDLYIYDPGPQEYVSKISTMEHLFEDAATPQAELSTPATNASIGMRVYLICFCEF